MSHADMESENTISNADTQSEDTISTCMGARPLDLGLIIKTGMSVKEVSTSVAALSRGEVYDLLTRHISPPTLLPTTHSYG